MHIDYIRIDGKVKLEKRQEFVNKFQTDETCLVAILSITACYTGITLTTASTVIFSELHMTPAVMIQAEDRAHRIGQEHECVNIHYLYGPDTLDEILFKMLNQKQNIFSNTLDNKSQNMEVKYTFKKVGDFEKGKSDLDVNINNKKIIITNSGSKNMTLNNFVFHKKNDNNNNDIDLKNINLHKSQIRRNREYTPIKKDVEESNEVITTEDINSIDMDVDDDDESADENVFQKLKNNMNTDDNINKPTKDKNTKIKNSNKSNKNTGKVVLKTISDYFK